MCDHLQYGSTAQNVDQIGFVDKQSKWNNKAKTVYLYWFLVALNVQCV